MCRATDSNQATDAYVDAFGTPTYAKLKPALVDKQNILLLNEALW